jgi:quercetin dioxygenase-like cupin family protein
MPLYRRSVDDPIIDVAALPRTAYAHELVGADHDVLVSLILIDCPPGEGPALHTHPYAELFVIESGEGSFHLDGADATAGSGQIVIAPANAVHGFTNTGSAQLRLTAIHTAPDFDTRWQDQPDTPWVSQ